MAIDIVRRRIVLFGFDEAVDLPPHISERIPSGISSLFYHHSVFAGDVTVFAPDPMLFCPPQSGNGLHQLTEFLFTQFTSAANPNTFESWLPVDQRGPWNPDHQSNDFENPLTSGELAEYGLWALDQVFLCGATAPQYVLIFLPREPTETACTATIWRRWLGLVTPFRNEEQLSHVQLTPIAEESWIVKVLDTSGLFDGRIPIRAEPVSRDDVTYGLHYCYHRFDERRCRRNMHVGSEGEDVGQRVRRNTDSLVLFPWEAKSRAKGDRVAIEPLLVSPDGRDVLAVRLKLRNLEVYVLPEPAETEVRVKAAVQCLVGLSPASEGECVPSKTGTRTGEPKHSLDECRCAKKEIDGMLRKLGEANPLIGDSEALLQIYPKILRAAKDPKLNVLIYGETGSGKEVLARLLSYFTKRPGHLVSEDATAISLNETLIRSRLFGIAKGVATEVTAQEGLLAQAEDGTLALDGMEYAPHPLQATLRRVFDPDHRKYRVDGVSGERPVKCRLVAMYNLPPRQLIQEGKCLPDYWRRFEVKIDIPPLLDRREDIPALVQELVRRRAQAKKITSDYRIRQLMPPQDLLREWREREWQGEDGNVRGLRDKVYEFVDNKLGPVLGEPGRGGRPPGSRAIPDGDLVAILRLVMRHPSAWDTERLLDQIDSRSARHGALKRTQAALLRRIQRISDEAMVEAFAPIDDMRKFRRNVTKAIRALRGFDKLPPSDPGGC